MTFPPPHLLWRATGNTNTEEYCQVGQRMATRLMDRAGSVRDVLDWGCGPGRVAVHVIRDYPDVTLRGCDIDAEAIAWCNENIASGQFDVAPVRPPLPYPDASFDAVLAVSVMTHLKRRMQTRWLREIARILRPDGVLLASVHGKAAAEAFGVTDLAGIQDHYINVQLQGIAPDGYYCDVIQDEAYTRMAWADWLDVTAYEEAALELHDLVTCRKPVK